MKTYDETTVKPPRFARRPAPAIDPAQAALDLGGAPANEDCAQIGSVAKIGGSQR